MVSIDTIGVVSIVTGSVEKELAGRWDEELHRFDENDFR